VLAVLGFCDDKLTSQFNASNIQLVQFELQLNILILFFGQLHSQEISISQFSIDVIPLTATGKVNLDSHTAHTLQISWKTSKKRMGIVIKYTEDVLIELTKLFNSTTPGT